MIGFFSVVPLRALKQDKKKSFKAEILGLKTSLCQKRKEMDKNMGQFKMKFINQVGKGSIFNRRYLFLD